MKYDKNSDFDFPQNNFSPKYYSHFSDLSCVEMFERFLDDGETFLIDVNCVH